MQAELGKMRAACDRIINYKSPRPSMVKSPRVSMDTVIQEHSEANMVPAICHSEDKQVSIGFMDLGNPVAAKFVPMVVIGKDDGEPSVLLRISLKAATLFTWFKLLSGAGSSGLHVHPDAFSTCSSEVNFQRMNPSVIATCTLVELHGWPPPAGYSYSKYGFGWKINFTVARLYTAVKIIGSSIFPGGLVFLHIGDWQASLGCANCDFPYGDSQHMVVLMSPVRHLLWHCPIQDWSRVVCFSMSKFYTNIFRIGNPPNDDAPVVSDIVATVRFALVGFVVLTLQSIIDGYCVINLYKLCALDNHDFDTELFSLTDEKLIHLLSLLHSLCPHYAMYVWSFDCGVSQILLFAFEGQFSVLTSSTAFTTIPFSEALFVIHDTSVVSKCRLAIRAASVSTSVASQITDVIRRFLNIESLGAGRMPCGSILLHNRYWLAPFCCACCVIPGRYAEIKALWDSRFGRRDDRTDPWAAKTLHVLVDLIAILFKHTMEKGQIQVRLSKSHYEPTHASAQVNFIGVAHYNGLPKGVYTTLLPMGVVFSDYPDHKAILETFQSFELALVILKYFMLCWSGHLTKNGAVHVSAYDIFQTEILVIVASASCQLVILVLLKAIWHSKMEPNLLMGTTASELLPSNHCIPWLLHVRPFFDVHDIGATLTIVSSRLLELVRSSSGSSLMQAACNNSSSRVLQIGMSIIVSKYREWQYWLKISFASTDGYGKVFIGSLLDHVMEIVPLYLTDSPPNNLQSAKDLQFSRVCLLLYCCCYVRAVKNNSGYFSLDRSTQYLRFTWCSKFRRFVIKSVAVRGIWFFDHDIDSAMLSKFRMSLFAAATNQLEQHLVLSAPLTLHSHCPPYWHFHLLGELKEKFEAMLTYNLTVLNLKAVPEFIVTFSSEPVIKISCSSSPPARYPDKGQGSITHVLLCRIVLILSRMNPCWSKALMMLWSLYLAMSSSGEQLLLIHRSLLLVTSWPLIVFLWLISWFTLNMRFPWTQATEEEGSFHGAARHVQCCAYPCAQSLSSLRTRTFLKG